MVKFLEGNFLICIKSLKIHMSFDLENIHLGMYFKELTQRVCKDLDFHFVHS